MKKATAGVLLLTFLFLNILSFRVLAQEKKGNNSELTIPWDEFKRLINLDNDDIVISLQIFQKLLAQTGITTTPQYTLRNGNVVLKRDEFKNLVNRMNPPPGVLSKPPFDYLITKAVYSGKMRKNNTLFTATFKIHVLKKNAYLKIPVLYRDIALSDIKVNSKPALVIVENGYHNVVISKAGEYTVTANFSVKTSLDKGPHKIDLTIKQTPITMLYLEMPLKKIEVEIPQAEQVQSVLTGGKTIVSAVIPQKSLISIRWRKKAAAAEKIPSKLYSEIYHLVSIDDDALKINSDINYNILHSEVDAVEIAIPDNMNVLNVAGEGVGEWQEITRNSQRFILVPFTYGKKGKVTIRVTAETPLTETGLTNLFRGFKTTGTVRETGFIGVELNTSAEVIISESEGLEKIAVQKLPAQLINKSVKPLIMGFKYQKHPYNLVLDIKKHEKIGVPVATINSASAVTLFTEDGKIVYRVVYQVRNSSKQFLQITLPADADVWSVFVDNQPVESSIGGKGKLLVPLIRSRSVNNQLKTFAVEIIYNMADEGFGAIGSQESNLPAVDILISSLVWSVYLPNGYYYNYFSSTLEKEEIIRGLNVFSSPGREYDESVIGSVRVPGDKRDENELKKIYKGKSYQSRFRNNKLEEDQMMSQVDAELEFSGRLKDLAKESPSVYGGNTGGVLPIQIEIPASGQVYRFAKSIIKPDDELSFSVVYSRMWVNDLVKWAVLILIILIIYLNRKKFGKPWNRVKEKSRSAILFINKNEAVIKKYSQSFVTSFVLFVLVIMFASISYIITVILFSLFLVSVINLIINYAKKRKHRKTKPEEQADNKEDETDTL